MAPWYEKYRKKLFNLSTSGSCVSAEHFAEADSSNPVEILPPTERLPSDNPFPATVDIKKPQSTEQLPSCNDILSVINHIFMPPHLHATMDLSERNEQALYDQIWGAAAAFSIELPDEERHLWSPILGLLKQFLTCHAHLSLSEANVLEFMNKMGSEDVMAFLIRAQNACVIIRHCGSTVVFESFEVSPPAQHVLQTQGRLIRSFPGPAIEIPAGVFGDPLFRVELSRFLSEIDRDTFDPMGETPIAKSGDTIHPRFITQLLTEILLGIGAAATVPRITKRVADDAIASSQGDAPWRRSATWLVMRVAIQTTLQRKKRGYRIYKLFVAFLHARILKKALESGLPSYLIACMQRKTARRLHKLASIEPFCSLKCAHEIVGEAKQVLNQRWQLSITAQKTSITSRGAPQNLDVAADTALSLSNSISYVKRVLNTAHASQSSQSFDPQCPRRFRGADNFSFSYSNELMKMMDSDDNFIALADFETAVRSSLENWVARNLRSAEGCLSVATRMRKYSSAALKAYQSNPELLSTRILTLFKLWVALDKIAVAQYPLLDKFSPEIPTDALHHLLLPDTELITELGYVETYLASRYSNATPGWSVFGNTADGPSFAVQYFEEDPELQALKMQIETVADQQKTHKLNELQNLQIRYQDVKKAAEAAICVCQNARDRGSSASNCRKCHLESDAKEMMIKVYEWPLPQEASMAKTVIFELRTPPPIMIWREITYYLLRDAAIPQRSVKDDNSVVLLYDHLPFKSLYVTSAIFPRTVGILASSRDLASAPEPLRVETATKKTIVIDHKPKWKPLNEAESTIKLNSESIINEHCVLKLPPGPYQSLQYAVSGTSHTSNDIITNQSECPPGLNLHEYIAFSRIRSGPRLQWLNVLSELRSSTLKFQEEAVYTLFKQAAWQVGPPMMDGQREWHIELMEKEFGMLLLGELSVLLDRLSVHWHNVFGILVITTLVSRLLTSAVDEDVVQECYKTMRAVRTVAYGWLNDILTRMKDIQDESRLQDCRIQLCKVATTCRSSYDVGPDRVSALLCDTSDVAIVLHCAILNHYHFPLSNSDDTLRNLIHRDCRLSHVLEPFLATKIMEFSEGLDEAVRRIWKFYRPSSEWKRLPSPNNRWVVTHTSTQSNQVSQVVHLDLLSGQLLVEGKPLNQLPRSIVTHPLYARIFGMRNLQVVPSDVGELDFKTTNAIGADADTGFLGYQVFFALRCPDSQQTADQLVIRTQKDSEILELVPHQIFEHDLPAVLVKDQTHWLNISTSKGEIEIRDLKTIWNSSSTNWRIRISEGGCSATRIINGGAETLRLVDQRSNTTSVIARQLQALGDPTHLMVTYSTSTDRVIASVIQFGLDFFLVDRSSPVLESVNMPQMVVDSDQSTGSMIGFKNQLVLRKKDSSTPPRRQVIIPYPAKLELQVSVASPLDHHPTISLILGDQDRIHYFVYTIDPILGRLVGDGSMLSKLYQIYLHAITSNCLPDPLTGQTGTEEALQQLGSAGLRSYQKLGRDERQLLHKLSRLTPIRTLDSGDLLIVSNIGHPIRPLSQQETFHRLAMSVLEHEETMKMFTSDTAGSDGLDFSHGFDHLQHRAGRHNAYLDRDQINSPRFLANSKDIAYTSRDLLPRGDAGVASSVSAMVFNWEPRANTDQQLSDLLEKYKVLYGVHTKISLAYSNEWLHRSSIVYLLPVCEACRKASKAANRYQMMFTFPAWAYTSPNFRPLISTIFAFSTVPELRTLDPPSCKIYHLAEGIRPKEGRLSHIVMQCVKDPGTYEGIRGEKAQKMGAEFDRRRAREAQQLVGQLESQWPCETPLIEKRESVFDIDRLNEEASKAFRTWFQNMQLLEYLQRVQEVLNGLQQLRDPDPGLYTFSPSSTQPKPPLDYITFQRLLETRHAPDIQPPPIISRDPSWFEMETDVSITGKLRDVLREFRRSPFPSDHTVQLAGIQQQYADDLEKSLRSLEKERDAPIRYNARPESQILQVVQEYHRQCEVHFQDTYQHVQQSLSPSIEEEHALHDALLWPPLTIRSLIGALAFGNSIQLTKPWQKALTSLARAVLALQHACRLMKYICECKPEELCCELEGVIESGGLDEGLSTRLLIQVDGDFLARRNQIDFTREMITPSSGRNSVFQLNMGEGKTSVILPMVAATLSDGKQLPRVVVLKQLAPSMFHLLVHRLGGFANRRVFCMPFTRSLQVTAAQARQIHYLHSLCVKERGILIMQPEHILSFKLLGLDHKFNDSPSSRVTSQRLISPTSSDTLSVDVATHLLKSQQWLDEHSRDILDESDEILHVRCQLVYTIGQRQPLQGSPDRWTIIQQVLTLVKKHAAVVKQRFQDGIEIHENRFSPGSYPFIRILHNEAGRDLVQLIVTDISHGVLEQCSFSLFPSELQPLILPFITQVNPTSEQIHLMEKYCKSSGFWNIVLILRGLFAHGLLVFVLKERRWRVDYGPDLSRSLLAVPYRAKDVPSLRAEFSHPDVVISLTCLSYYWQGLSEKQSEECFTELLKKGDPKLLYEKWILQSQSIPDTLKHIDGIVIHDPVQRVQLHRYLHRNQAMIDFFLSQLVFPRGISEFPKTIAASGWDLAEKKNHVTTGFSGTNDRRYLLPISIQQGDPLHQLATNARVLTHILQPENDHYSCIHSSQQVFEKLILQSIGKQRHKIQVLLDVGAQMLTLSNEEVAAEWLNLSSTSDALAVIFFGHDDEPYVRTRDGSVEGFISSPFRSQLDKCLLYLDDAHTRGTDFKLPLETRAAVTLGPKVTKDRLVQGCMRMRQLGHGHSVMFFASQEVDLLIKHAAGLSKADTVRVKHILLWAMQQSCEEVVHWIPRWAQQGVDYRRRKKAWMKFKESRISPNDALASAWIRDEHWSLDDMYAPGSNVTALDCSRRFQDHPDILKQYQKWAVGSLSDTHYDDEDEREVMLEIEKERKVAWQPKKAIACTPHIHQDLRSLIENGIFISNSPAILSLFQPLGGMPFETHVWSSRHLFATKEFLNAVDTDKLDEGNDPCNYLRPVNWILSTFQSKEPVWIVMSPDEVNLLLPDIRRSKKVHLHMYTPRVTQSMKPVDDLLFHCIPSLSSRTTPKLDITMRLNLWGGQLYFRDYETYKDICNFLGLYSWQPGPGDRIQIDGFVEPEHRLGTPLHLCTFRASPVPYLKKLFELRRKGIDYFPTHIGKMLHGRLLEEEDFQGNGVGV
ncbi:hypothetical protein FRC02_008200 [Tulasnella sp. 418]|nr:hypothetical protein FRC02_008200 [Tulasnella sp. 418]